MGGFYHGCWRPTLPPPICSASTLPTTTSLQSLILALAHVFHMANDFDCLFWAHFASLMEKDMHILKIQSLMFLLCLLHRLDWVLCHLWRTNNYPSVHSSYFLFHTNHKLWMLASCLGTLPNSCVSFPKKFQPRVYSSHLYNEEWGEMRVLHLHALVSTPLLEEKHPVSTEFPLYFCKKKKSVGHC